MAKRTIPLSEIQAIQSQALSKVKKFHDFPGQEILFWFIQIFQKGKEPSLLH